MAPVESHSILSSRMRAFVIVLCVVSALASTVGLVYGGKIFEPAVHGNDSYDRGPLGHRAFFETLNHLGVEASRRRDGHLAQVEEPVILLEPVPRQPIDGRSSLDLSDVIHQRSMADLSSIIVLPKWTYDEEYLEPVALPVSISKVEQVLEGVLLGYRVQRAGEPHEPARAWTMVGNLGRFSLEIPWLQTLSAPANTEVLLGTQEEALVIYSDDDNIVVVSDPSIFHNVSLHRADHPRLWFSVLEYAGVQKEIVIDEAFHGHWQRRSLPAALGGFPAVLILIHTIFLGVVVVAAGTKRFGTPIVPRDPFERGPKDIVRLTAQVMTVGHSPGLLAESYVEQTLDEIVTRLGLTETGGIKKRAEAIDEILVLRGRSKTAVSLLERVQNLATHHPNDSVQSVSLARQAWRLRNVLFQQATSTPVDASDDYAKRRSARDLHKENQPSD